MPTPTSNRDDRPAAHIYDSIDISYPQQSSSCTATTRPTSATRDDRPAAFNDSTNLSFPQRSSSCILRVDRHQLPATIVQLHSTTRPTSATSNDHLAASLRLDHTSYWHHPSSWKHIYYYHELYTRAYKHDNKLSSLLYLLPRLCFLHCLRLSILACFNICGVDVLIGSATTLLLWMKSYSV